MLFEHLQGRRLHHLSGQPIPVPDHPFREVVFPNIHPESSLGQLEAIPSSPITSYTREEANPQWCPVTEHKIMETNRNARGSI